MKALLVAIDAKFIQTNLAVRSLSAYVAEHSDFSVGIAEYTINQPIQTILASLYNQNADVYLFSTYLWNISESMAIITDLKKINPNAKYFIGGPEATYHTATLLANHPALDGIILGEGEATLLELLTMLKEEKAFDTCKGLALPHGYTAPRAPLSMDDLPFCYGDFALVKNRILYYESMRGCPFSCSYCLSSVEQGVRFRSLPLVFSDLKRFLDANVPQVKFVDRTFNCKKSHAMGIWQYLKDHDNGVTNFHFELAGELLDEEMTALLATLRPGLCQFEIGVQSTNKETLAEIDRPFSFEKLSAQVAALQKPQNIHLHLDLIAGLPYEDYDSFHRSFNDVFALKPHQLQLGFLKVLGGSKMETKADDYGLIYQEIAPYEVLQTRWISFDELSVLHGIDDMVDHYYNSGRYAHTLEYMLGDDPFTFFLALSRHFQKMSDGKPVSKTGYHELLGSFQQERDTAPSETMQWKCKFDLLLHENLRKVPSWISVDVEADYRGWIREFYQNEENISSYLPNYADSDPKQVARITHLEVFPFHPESEKQGATAVLFDYSKRDLLGKAIVSFHDVAPKKDKPAIL